jgi:hypothetical protein
MATSQNGWPALPSGSPALHKWVVPGADRHFVLRNGSAGFLLCHYVMWHHRNIDRLDMKGDPWDEWGYAYREIRGSETDLSNHASGTAVDLNATRYPLGTTHMSEADKRKIRKRLRLYNGCIRSGAFYEGRKDEMHFEIDRPLEACERVARRLLNTPRGVRLLKANPGQLRVIRS